MTNPAYQVGRNVRDKAAMQLWKIVKVEDDGLHCERKHGRKKEKRRFAFDDVEPYAATGAVGITIYR
jgi:hypothetical protein